MGPSSIKQDKRILLVLLLLPFFSLPLLHLLLGCTGLYCEKRVYEELYTISSLAAGDKNNDGVSGVEDPNDYDCLYFPSGAKRSQESHPMRVPRIAQNDFTWMGTVDGSADTDV